MRIVIEDRQWNASTPYRLRIDDALVELRRPRWSATAQHNELWWEWQDGRIYRVQSPLQNWRYASEWHIVLGGMRVCSGTLARWSVLPVIQWRWSPADASWSTCTHGCCGAILRDAEGKKLGLARRGCRSHQVVVRPRLAPDVTPIVIGAIIASCCD